MSEYASFTLRLPLFEIFKDFMKDQEDNIKLIYLRYIFETLFEHISFEIDKEGILTIVREYGDILDAACDMLLNTSDDEVAIAKLQKDDCVGFVEYTIFHTDDYSDVGKFKDHDYTRSSMFNEIVKYFDKFFGYSTAPYDHLIIIFNYETLKKYCVESEDTFDKDFKESIMNYGSYGEGKKMSLTAYERYMQLVKE